MSRRWLRFAGPLAAVVALTAGTLVAHAIEQVDPGDPAYLSPTDGSGIGGRTLAGRLAAHGITVERMTSTPAALQAAGSDDDVTVFVPAPDLVNPDYLPFLAGHASVLVAPDPVTAWTAGLHVDVGGPRWAAATRSPGCTATWARGSAAVLRRVYRPTDEGRTVCYAGGVLETDRNGPPVTLVGAADPFRNDRIGEHGNEAFAVALLSRTRRVVWLDLHQRELPSPAPTPSPGGPTTAPARQQTPGDDSGDPPPQAQPPDGPSLTDAFPPTFWAVVALLALAATALALAAGRRLGTPVAEPLPVRVRSAETVRGLGGLYRRAKADRESLATIQAAARRRITEHLGLPPDAPVGEHIIGVPPQVADRLLADPDQDLATTAEAVQNLVRHVRGNKL